MSISFYVNSDGQLTPRPIGLSARQTVELEAPAFVWRPSPRRHHRVVLPALAITVAGGALLLAMHFR